MGVKWDDELPENEIKLFQKWCREIPDLEKIHIPRLSTGGDTDRRNWQMHVFCDASKISFSSVIYLRVKADNGTVGVHFLAAKSRVAPIKLLTIPKLELMSCLVGTRLASSVKQALNLEEIKEVYWSDSLTALAWIHRDDQWGTFVANRTREINKATNKSDWRHVPGVANPADLPSRGCSPSKLLDSKWWEGPAWLLEEEGNWPNAEELADEKEILAEKRKSEVVTTVTSCAVSIGQDKEYSFLKLIRITGWVRRFLHNKFVKDSKKRKSGLLSKDELRKAELIFVRNIQRESFPTIERERLKGLELVEDDWGILRIKTRLLYRDDPPSFKFPILLPNNREEVKQLIRDTHRYYCHAGVGFMTTILRKKYWIIKARHTVKHVISKCCRCRRYAAKPIIPEPAPLPLDRVKSAEVFEVVGVDLAGPLVLKDGKKVWLCIFTCAVYRAVHFELVKTISTNSFIKALARFVEKYRRPAIIYSDNGTNFRGADNLFKKIDWAKIEKDDKTTAIEWKFNPVTSSWWGGWFERLIGTAKELLKRTVGKGSLNWEELKKIIIKIQNVMNERPLTYVSENVDDLEPLTPSLFLHPLGSTDFPEGEIADSQHLRRRKEYLETLSRELKSRFLKEYLSMLINRNPKKPTRNLCVGELVLVGCDNVKRINWPLGRVLGLIPGRDGVTRLAKVKTAKGEITRSVQRLFPLEMDTQDGTEKVMKSKGVTTRSGRKVQIPNRFL